MRVVDEVGHGLAERMYSPLARAPPKESTMMCPMAVWVTRFSARSRPVAERPARTPSSQPPPGSRSDDPATAFQRRNVELEACRETKLPPPPMTENVATRVCTERLERGQPATWTDCRRSTSERPAWRLASRADDDDAVPDGLR